MTAPVEEDVTVSLVLMKDSLLEAIGCSVDLIVPDHVATFVAEILDQVLVQAHLSSANRLGKRLRGPTPAPALTGGLPGLGNAAQTSSGSARLGPWMSTFAFGKPDGSYSKTPTLRTAADTGDVRCLVQEMTGQTSAGFIRATLIQGSNKLVSKVLYFSIAFQPRNGSFGRYVTLEFVSLWFHMMSLLRPPIEQPVWMLSSSDYLQSWTINAIVKQPHRSHSETLAPPTASQTGILWSLVQEMMRRTHTRLICATLIEGDDGFVPEIVYFNIAPSSRNESWRRHVTLEVFLVSDDEPAAPVYLTARVDVLVAPRDSPSALADSMLP
ncbi:hypothetical protein CTA2_12253 [Colletotrichum tanaceti]|nr:hypothetical protein CTA2_12253 [Colletotrichum tanaceti]